MSTLKITEIEELARRALTKAGATQEAASSLARAIAAAERDGIAFAWARLSRHLLRASRLRQSRRRGGAASRVSTTPGIIAVDAGSGFAHPAIDAGFAALVPLARSQGIALLDDPQLL